MTRITKSVDVDETIDVDVDIELSDVKEFIEDADNDEIYEILKACKYIVKDNLEEFIDINEFGIETNTLDDHFKLKAIKEIWNDLTVEEVESFVNNFKTILKDRRK